MFGAFSPVLVSLQSDRMGVNEAAMELLPVHYVNSHLSCVRDAFKKSLFIQHTHHHRRRRTRHAYKFPLLRLGKYMRHIFVLSAQRILPSLLA